MKRMVFCLVILLCALISAQEENTKAAGSCCVQAAVSADVVSQYLWRGVLFNDGPSIQPCLSLSASNFELGFWGSVPFSQPAKSITENDFYLKYKHECSCGLFALTATDYFFPSYNLSFANYRNNGEGAHTVDVNLSYAGTEKFPVALQFSANVYNDTSNAMYAEAGYTFKLGENDLAVAVGGTFNNNTWYETTSTGFQIINICVSTSKTIKITESFSFPLSLAYCINPSAEKSFLILKASF